MNCLNPFWMICYNSDWPNEFLFEIISSLAGEDKLYKDSHLKLGGKALDCNLKFVSQFGLQCREVSGVLTEGKVNSNILPVKF